VAKLLEGAMISLVMAMALFASGEPAAAPAPKKAKDPNEMVCKREKVSGSNMKSRVCMTAAQWEERTERDKEMVDAAQRSQPMKGE
jgi:hypothetical protein